MSENTLIPHSKWITAAAVRTWKGKRLLDFLMAGLALIMLAPLLGLIAFAVWLDSPGPILFRQERVGQGGRRFTLYKFRSMYTNADPTLHQQYVQSFIQNCAAPQAGATDAAPMFKLVNDPRITRLGALLRKSSLDELPQLLNVLRGEMSLVGPRPPLPYEVEKYQEWHWGRLDAPPGLTGWWQVYGRSRVTFDEMVRMDLQYIEEQSFWLDLKLLLLTIPAVVMTRGAK